VSQTTSGVYRNTKNFESKRNETWSKNYAQENILIEALKAAQCRQDKPLKCVEQKVKSKRLRAYKMHTTRAGKHTRLSYELFN